MRYFLRYWLLIKALIECLGDAPETFNPASDDAEFEKKGKAKPARLYKFLDPNPIGEGKFIKQKLLLETECYLLIGPGLWFSKRQFKVINQNPLLMYSANLKDSKNADRWLAALSTSIAH